MNTTGLNIIKTLGCLTAVTFFTVYNTYDNYNYNYDTILAFLTFISTIATPLFLWSPVIWMPVHSTRQNGN